jgi:hypothetical protein
VLQFSSFKYEVRQKYGTNIWPYLPSSANGVSDKNVSPKDTTCEEGMLISLTTLHSNKKQSPIVINELGKEKIAADLQSLAK